MQIYKKKDLKNEKSISSYNNKIIQGDAEQILELLPLGSIDLVVTSPPYDDLRDYNKKIIWNFNKFKKIASKLYLVLKSGGVIVWVVGDKVDKKGKTLNSYRQALYFQEIGFKVYDVIIYEKAGTGPPHSRRYFNAFEYMFVLSKGNINTVNLLKDKKNKWGNKSTFSSVTRREKDGSLTNKGQKVIQEFGVRTNIWKYTNGKNFSTRDSIAYKHPAIFPEKLVEDHIKSWSNEGDVVLDPFGGSGTTIKIASILNRNWIYIESVPSYCKIASERMKKVFVNG